MKTIAIFDFDNTLITGDAFLPFLIFTSGTITVYAAIIESLVRFALCRVQKNPPQNLRTFVKKFLLHRILKGKKIENLKEAIAKTRQWQKLNIPIVHTLHEHHAKGDTILIASGSLNLYLPELLHDIPHDAVICTDIGVQNGVVTGDMNNGNCTRHRKAERIATWLHENGPFDESFGYGNYPHDLPMLSLVKHRIIVS